MYFFFTLQYDLGYVLSQLVRIPGLRHFTFNYPLHDVFYCEHRILVQNHRGWFESVKSLDFGNQTLERYDLERFNSTIGRMFPWLKNLSLASHKHDFLRVLQLELFRILPRVTNPKLSFL